MKNLLINIYKNNELYLQRKLNLTGKAQFLGSSPESDLVLPVQELNPFQFLLVPPNEKVNLWRVCDEHTEEIISLNNDQPVIHHWLQWAFEFEVKEHNKTEWQLIKHNPDGDILVLTFSRDQEIIRRQYIKAKAKMEFQWSGQKIQIQKSQIKSSSEALSFNNEQESLTIALARQSELKMQPEVIQSLKSAAAFVMIFIFIIGMTQVWPESKTITKAQDIESVMVVKIPSANPLMKKNIDNQMGNKAQHEMPVQQGSQKSQASHVTQFGKAFKRFSKGLQGSTIVAHHLSSGFATGNLGSKLQGLAQANFGGTTSIYNGTNIGSTMGKGVVGVQGIRLLEDELESSGGLKKEIIAQYIKSYLGQIVQCFERELSIQPDLTGKVVVNFTINGKGMVSQAGIQKSQFDNARFHGCITQKVARWSFPVPDGGINVVVNYPFLFRAQ